MIALGRALLVTLLAAASCTFSKPADVLDPDATDGCIGNPGVCTGTDTDCVADQCVDCPLGDDLESSACTEAGAPICGADHDCRPCRVHEECDSGVCAPDGTCPTTNVLYVRTDGNDAGGTNDCTRMNNPCQTLTRAVALVPPTGSNPTANRRFIRMIDGGYYLEPDAVTIDGKTVTIVGPPAAGGRAVLDRFGTGPTLVIQNASDVRLERIAATNAMSGTTVDGIVCTSSTLVATGIEVHNNGGTGIVATACELTLLRSVLVPDDGDFKFLAPGARDYHLQTTSIAKDKGTTTDLAPEAMTDIDGEPRPQGLPDVGADEIP